MRTQLFYIAGGILLLQFAACSSDPSARLGEPNGSIEEAGFLKDGQAIEMAIDSIGDQDWYGFTLPEDGYVKVAAKDVPKGSRLRARFAEKRDWEDPPEKWITEHKRLPAVAEFRDRDTVFFAVDERTGTAAPESPFKLKAEFIPSFDPHEPNDGLDEATELEPGEWIRSYIFPEGDRDHFAVEVEEPGYLFAEPKKEPEGISPEVRFHSYDRMDGSSKVISGYRSLPASASIPEAGRYFVELGDDHDDASSREPIEWRVDHIEEMDSTEPNIVWEDAHPVRIGDSVELAIFPEGDRDILKVEAERNMRIRVSSERIDRLEPSVLLTRQAEGRNPDITDWARLPADLPVEEPGTYFITLRDEGDDDSSPDPFVIHIEELGRGS